MSDPVNQLKIMTVVGTRPELIKMSRVMNEFENHSKHILVHSGQNFDYELNEIFFKDLGIRKPDYFLNAVGDSVAESIGLIISKADKVFEREKPDALVLYGDTNTCLAVIAAKRRKIPIFPLEAGKRSFEQRIPEEINRKIVDHLSDINLPLTEHARRYLLNEGLRPETVIKIGGTMREVLDYYADDIKSADILSRLRLRSGEYIVVSSHREENVDSPENLSDLLDSLEALAAQYRIPVIVSTHPRTRLRLDVLLSESKRSMSEHIKYLKPFGFFDYVKLQQEAACVLSDSGTITEESSLLGFPAVTIRQSHERPEGMDSGVLSMSGLKSQRVLQAVAIMITHTRDAKNRCQVDDYEQQEVSKKVLKIVVSYVDYINRNVWRFSDC